MKKIAFIHLFIVACASSFSPLFVLDEEKLRFVLMSTFLCFGVFLFIFTFIYITKFIFQSVEGYGNLLYAFSLVVLILFSFSFYVTLAFGWFWDDGAEIFWLLSGYGGMSSGGLVGIRLANKAGE